jgi:hypothetical protein
MKGFDLEKYNSVISRGLCKGQGTRRGRMCIQAAVCYALGLPHGDDPECVIDTARVCGMRLNDASWSSPAARAAGLWEFGIAQLGSKGVVDNLEFVKRFVELTIREFIPEVFRELLPKENGCLVAASRCETEGTMGAARAAADAVYVAAGVPGLNAASVLFETKVDAANVAYAVASIAANAACDVARAVNYAALAARDTVVDSVVALDTVRSANAAANAAASAVDVAIAANKGLVAEPAVDSVKNDRYLIKSAQLALRVLRELKSPGCELL